MINGDAKERVEDPPFGNFLTYQMTKEQSEEAGGGFPERHTGKVAPTCSPLLGNTGSFDIDSRNRGGLRDFKPYISYHPERASCSGSLAAPNSVSCPLG